MTEGRRIREGLRIALIAALAGTACTGDRDESGDPALPTRERFWSWQEPLGAAAGRTDIVAIVRHGASLAPESAADRCCNEILSRGLGPEDVCITIQSFGTNDSPYPIFKHPGDRMAGHDTVWMSQGIAQAAAWFEPFAARYVERQSEDPRIPDPARFQFDAEHPVVPDKFDQPIVFDLMKRDPRWASEAVAGFAGKPLVQLYLEAGEPACDPTLTWNHPVNRAWTIWFAQVCHTAADAALDEAAFRKIRLCWPACRYGNFATSVNFDGGGSPPRLQYHPGATWYRWTVRGSGTTQSPVFYWSDPIDTQTRLDFMLGSSPAVMTPWILAVGHYDADRGESWTQELFREHLKLLRSRGVSEFLLFGNAVSQTEEFWNQTLAVIEER